jgi:TRAP-type C4-dicarboxylate transport system permease small subunit
MKKIANSLMPFAAIVLVAVCLISVFSLLVVSLESVGLAGGVPWSYYQRLNIGLISVALPVVGMILFGMILLGLREKAAKADIIEMPKSQEKKEEDRLKAAA